MIPFPFLAGGLHGVVLQNTKHDKMKVANELLHQPFWK
jgi:hypothetical protein